MAPSKGMEEKDNQAPVFSGETKDWPTFKDAIQMRADKHDTTWLFEGGRSLAEFFDSQIKENVLSQGASHRNAGLQPLLHAHVVREDEALDRQSESSARSTAMLQQEHESCALARSADKRREVGKGLSLADTQTGR